MSCKHSHHLPFHSFIWFNDYWLRWGILTRIISSRTNQWARPRRSEPKAHPFKNQSRGSNPDAHPRLWRIGPKRFENNIHWISAYNMLSQNLTNGSSDSVWTCTKNDQRLGAGHHQSRLGFKVPSTTLRNVIYEWRKLGYILTLDTCLERDNFPNHSVIQPSPPSSLSLSTLHFLYALLQGSVSVSFFVVFLFSAWFRWWHCWWRWRWQRCCWWFWCSNDGCQGVQLTAIG